MIGRDAVQLLVHLDQLHCVIAAHLLSAAESSIITSADAVGAAPYDFGLLRRARRRSITLGEADARRRSRIARERGTKTPQTGRKRVHCTDQRRRIAPLWPGLCAARER